MNLVTDLSAGSSARCGSAGAGGRKQRGRCNDKYRIRNFLVSDKFLWNYADGSD